MKAHGNQRKEYLNASKIVSTLQTLVIPTTQDEVISHPGTEEAQQEYESFTSHMAFTIFFATSTGKTEDVADRLKELIPGTEAKDVDNISSIDELVSAEQLICCIPTWNTGAEEARSGTAWDDLIQEIPDKDFAGKAVAIVGLGDSSGYGDYFCDAMEELYTAFLQSGAKLIGKVSTEGYTFDESKSVIDGKFCGLAIDEDNESELTDQRLSAWIQQINSEA